MDTRTQRPDYQEQLAAARARRHEMLRLRTEEQMTLQAIADRFGVSKQNVHEQLQKAREEASQ